MGKSERPEELLIRLDPFIPVGVPVSHKWAVPAPHYERLSTILKGMPFEDARTKYPEIGRLLADLAEEGPEGEEPG